MTEADRDTAMMRRALEQAALAAQAREVPVGAVVFHEAGVLAAAHNRRESDADPTAHAEMLALREAARRLGTWRLDGCQIAVTLEPCPMCAGALINSRIDRLIYGATDPKMGCVETFYALCTDARFNHRLEVRGGVLAAECASVLQAFFQARRAGDKPDKPPGGESSA